MRLRGHRTLYVAMLAVSMNAVLPPPLWAEGWTPWTVSAPKPTNVEKLAHKIDRLEKHLDTYGSIVPKAPDVWGEARLTKYRREYEEVMEPLKGQFKVTINAAISRSDQAFLANAFALQAAVGTAQSPQAITQSTEISTTDAALNRSSQTSLSLDNIAIEGTKGISLEPTIALDQHSRYLNHLHELRRISDGDDKADSPGYALHLVRLPISVLPGKITRQGYGAEVSVIAKPHLHDELLPTTFRGLVINDLVDQLGFPLAKFLDGPDVAGKMKEYEAYFKLNETPEGIALANAVKELLNNLKAVRAFDPTEADPMRFEQSKQAAIKALSAIESELLPIVRENARTLGLLETCELVELDVKRREVASLAATLRSQEDDDDSSSEEEKSPYDHVKSFARNLDREQFTKEDFIADSPEALREIRSVYNARLDRATNLLYDVGEALTSLATDLSGLQEFLESEIAVPTISIGPSRRSRLPFPPAHLFDVYGVRELFNLAKLALPLKSDDHNRKHTLLLDLQKILSEEFNATYEFLSVNEQIWPTVMASHEAIRTAVRLEDAIQLEALRSQFYVSLAGLLSKDVAELKSSHTAAMAWMVVVESALLNQRLRQDIRELASAKNAYHLNVDSLDWMEFFGSNPSPEARMLFNDYVNCRWPIHVVAVDPITQDQNVADSFSLRRELQLALSLGFASGRITAANFTRMARRLELDMETVDLNRTVVGFSHGNDTFGWRFYPRVQSPDTGGHLQTFAVDMFKGISRDENLNARRLEPGIREVTAIVIMPTFVPYVIFDTRTSWFRLADHAPHWPLHKALARKGDLSEAVDLSREITELRELSTACMKDAHLYRPDEVYRLKRAVDQLDRRLPLQTQYVQMPFENSLGGFEFFNTGTPDLAPELHGFYGEPGIRVQTDASKADAAKKTSLFLVGNNFSVHETNVIAGNTVITGDDMQLISRQVMRINIPETVTTVTNGSNDPFVDIHVATPYGVSNHVLVPAIPASADAAKAVADVVKAEIAKHVTGRHLDQYTWSGKDVCAVLQLGQPGETAALAFTQVFPGIRYGSSVHKNFVPTRTEVACHVSIKYKDVAKAETKIIDPVTSEDFTNGVAKLEKQSGTIAERITALIEANRSRKGLQPKDIESITLRAVLRVHFGNTNATRQVLPLDGDPLTVKLTIVDPPKPKAVSAVPEIEWSDISPAGDAGDVPNSSPIPVPPRPQIMVAPRQRAASVAPGFVQ